jgi:ferredoxin
MRSVAEIVFQTRRGALSLPVAELCAPDEATLLDAVRHVGLPLGQSCRGEGVCRSCAVDVLAGDDQLGAASPLERRFGHAGARRLACQARLPAPASAARVVVGHPSWGRPPQASSEPDAPAGSAGPTGPAAGATVDP